MYFERDVNCVRRFFRKRYNYWHEKVPSFAECLENKEKDLDVLVSASGFSYKMAKELDRFITREADEESNDEDGSGSEEEEEDEQVVEPFAPIPPPSADFQEGVHEETITTKLGCISLASNREVLNESQLDAKSTSHESTGSENNDGNAGHQVETSGEGEGAKNQGEGEESQDGDEDNNEEEEEEEEGDGEEEQGLEKPRSDGPNAYLEFDYASQRSNATARRHDVDDIRKRVKRDFKRKSKQAQRKNGNSLKRNVVKSKEKRTTAREIATGGAWV
jgi:RIO kinase 2